MQGIQTGIEPDADVVILPFRALSVNLIRAQQFCDLVIIRKDSAAVAIAAQRLGGEEGCGGNIAEGAALSSLIGRAGALGGVLDPFDSFLLERGIKTLPLRLARHEENTHAIARYLSAHPGVEAVFYPGLESDPG